MQNANKSEHGAQTARLKWKHNIQAHSEKKVEKFQINFCQKQNNECYRNAH